MEERRKVAKEWFERVDEDKTRTITASQLQRALGVGHLEFPISVVQQMIRIYDFDNNGTMSFPEFVALNDFLVKIQQTFSELERGRGYLIPDDVYKALVKLGFTLDSPSFYTVCESFDQEKTGRFRLDNLMALCIFMQSSRNLFNSFDTAKQGRVTLDFNQFIYCRYEAPKSDWWMDVWSFSQSSVVPNFSLEGALYVTEEDVRLLLLGLLGSSISSHLNLT